MMTQLALVRVPEPLGPCSGGLKHSVHEIASSFVQGWSFLVCRDDDTTCLGSCSGAFRP